MYRYQRIRARTMIPSVPQLHSVTSASMLKPSERPCSKTILGRSPEYPCKNLNVIVPVAYGHQPKHLPGNARYDYGSYSSPARSCKQFGAETVCAPAVIIRLRVSPGSLQRHWGLQTKSRQQHAANWLVSAPR